MSTVQNISRKEDLYVVGKDYWIIEENSTSTCKLCTKNWIKCWGEWDFLVQNIIARGENKLQLV